MQRYSPAQFIELPPPLAGIPGTTQGVYGDAGNLEFVAPDPHDGFWVFWFNGDALDHRQGPPAGRWSGGLHIVTGTVVSSVNISQVVFGPYFLEAVIVEAGTASRVVWSPDQGFVRAEELIRCAEPMVSAIVGTTAALHCLVRGADGRVSHLRAGVERYPELVWHPVPSPDSTDVVAISLSPDPARPDGLLAALISSTRVTALQFTGDEWVLDGEEPTDWLSVCVVAGGDRPCYVGLTRTGVVQLGEWTPAYAWRLSEPAIPTADTVAACWSSLEGGVIEILTLHASEITHVRWHTASRTVISIEKPVLSVGWADRTTLTLQREIKLT